jgi:hypothetical protein
MGTILTRKPLLCKHFGASWERLGSLTGGEGDSQSPLKDRAFSIFLDQNPPLELRPENGISPLTKARPAQWLVTDNSAIKRLAKGKLPSHRSAWSVGVYSPKAKVTR